MLANQFRIIDKSRQSLSVLLAFEQVNERLRTLPHVYVRPVVAAAVTTWNPLIIKTCLSSLIANGNGDISVDNPSRLSGAEIVFQSIVHYSKSFAKQPWWQDMLTTLIEENPKLLITAKRREIIRGLVGVENSRKWASKVELMAEKSLGIDISQWSSLEAVERFRYNPKTFGSLLNEDEAHAKTEALCVEMDSILDESYSSCTGTHSPVSVSWRAEPDNKQSPSFLLFVKPQRNLHKLFPALMKQEKDDSFVTLMDALARWKSSPPSQPLPLQWHNQQLDHLTLMAMHWYLRLHPFVPPHKYVYNSPKPTPFNFDAFVAQFVGYERLIPKFFHTFHHFSYAIFDGGGEVFNNRESFIKAMEALSHQVVEERERERRVSLAADLLVTAALLGDKQVQTATFSAPLLLSQLQATLPYDEMMEAVTQAMMSEKYSINAVHFLGKAFRTSTSKPNLTKSEAAINVEQAALDLVSERKTAFAFVNTFSEQRKLKGLSIDRDCVDFMVSYMLFNQQQFNVPESVREREREQYRDRDIDAEPDLEEINAKSKNLLVSGLFQPQRIIEAINLESAWNPTAPFPFHHANLLITLCSSSYLALTEKEDRQTLKNFVDRFLDNWELLVFYDLKQHQLLRAVVKFYCIANEVDLAKELALKATYPDIRLFEPLMFTMCRRFGDLDDAKVLFNHILALGLQPSKKIIDSIVEGHLLVSAGQDALDIAIELYQQHNIIPSRSVFRRMMKLAIEKDDQEELVRIQDAVLDLFGEELN
jgi:hypothetical protein